MTEDLKMGQMRAVEGIKPCECLLTAEELQTMVKDLAARITEDYKGEEVLLVGVLKGAFVFMADLAREIDLMVETDFIAVSSYQGSKSTGIVRILKDVDHDITGKNVILVEDIIDTGLTLKKLSELLKTRSPKSLELCTALDKPSRRQVEIDVKYRGIEIPDHFVVGYGLDYNSHYRNLQDIYIMGDAEE